MRVGLLTIGTRGDVQPVVALGLRLRDEKFDVFVGAPPNHRAFVEKFGLRFHGTGIDTKVFMERFPTMSPQELGVEMDRMWTLTNQHSWEVCEQEKPDIILFHQAVRAGNTIAEKLNILAIEMCFAPWTPSSSFRNYYHPFASQDDPVENLFSQLQIIEGTWLSTHARGQANKLRTDVSLDVPYPFFAQWHVHRELQIPLICAWSPQVLAVPDWDPPVYVTGYLFLDEDTETNWTPPQELQDFISAGDPPIFISFGSMFSGNTQANFQTILESIEKTQQRAIISSGWAGLRATVDLPKNVLLIGDAPHRWLLPRMKVIVHHGGAGSTAAAIRAGVPAIVVPHIVDQPFWGRVVNSLGVAAPPIPVSEFTTEKFVEAIEAILNDSGIHTRAKELAQKLEKENGIQNVIDIIKLTLSNSESRLKANHLKDLFNSRLRTLWDSIEIEGNTKPHPQAVWTLIEVNAERKKWIEVVSLMKFALSTFSIDVLNSTECAPTVQQVEHLVNALRQLKPQNRDQYVGWLEKFKTTHSLADLLDLINNLGIKLNN